MTNSKDRVHFLINSLFLAGLSITTTIGIFLLPFQQAKAREDKLFQGSDISIPSYEVTNHGGYRFADGGYIDWCMSDEFVRQVQSLPLDGTRFTGQSPTIGERPGCSKAARETIADAFCQLKGFQQAEVINVKNLKYIYTTNGGRQVRDGVGRVMYTPRLAEGRNGQVLIPGWTQINDRSQGKFDYILCSNTSNSAGNLSEQPNNPNNSSINQRETTDSQYTCGNSFSPSSFQGRTGKVAFYNQWSAPVTVILYHPNSSSIYNRYTVPPGQNQFLGDNIIVGDDWGVCFENKPDASDFVNNLGTISDYNPNYQGSPLFMIQNDRIK